METIFQRISDTLDGICERYHAKALWMQGGLIFLMAAVIAFLVTVPSVFHPAFIILQFILVMLQLVCAALFLPHMEQEGRQSKGCKALIYGSLVLFALFLAVAPLRYLQWLTQSGAIGTLLVPAGALALLLAAVALRSDAAKKGMAALESGGFGAFGQKQKVHPGDVVLCVDKNRAEAGERDPRVILPKEDRFLHMLILGPTGCGKTSQVILPMILQDIQNPEYGVTVLEPKGDLAIKVAMMAEHYGREAIYFDPSYKNCPKFNPLFGREVDVVENMATTFKMLNPDSPQFFLDLNEQLIRNAIKVLKRLDRDAGINGKNATLINLSRLLQNSGGAGRELVNNFARISSPTEAEAKENADIAAWFLNDYFTERSKVYENTSGVRSQVSKLVSNEYLREVLNPDVENGERNEINFDKHLAEGGVICISTAQGTLRDLSRYLGYFIILSFQSAVFRRPGNEDTRRPHFLTIDEFQTYSTPGFADMLTQGRSYRVASTLATQNRALMAMGGGKDGKNFVELVSTNARNVILFPGMNNDDAKYYSAQFGEYEKTEVSTGVSRKKFNLLTGGLDPLGHPTESVREQKKMTANFTTTDLIFGRSVGSSFGEIVYCIVQNKSIQPAGVGKISYIPKDLNAELTQKIEEYSAAYARESAAEFWEREEDTAGPDEPGQDLCFDDSAALDIAEVEPSDAEDIGMDTALVFDDDPA